MFIQGEEISRVNTSAPQFSPTSELKAIQRRIMNNWVNRALNQLLLFSPERAKVASMMHEARS